MCVDNTCVIAKCAAARERCAASRPHTVDVGADDSHPSFSMAARVDSCINCRSTCPPERQYYAQSGSFVENIGAEVGVGLNLTH